MRRSRSLPVVLLALVAAPIAFAAPACSSSNATSSPDAGDGGGIPPNQFQGAPCDPTLANPCLPVPCYTAICKEDGTGANVCATGVATGCGVNDDDGGIVLEASAGTDSATPTCESDHDCPTIPATDASLAVVYVCAFSAFSGCQAVGECVLPDPPHLLDGAVQTACGCEGQSVLYVTDQRTSSPVQSPAPCAATVAPDSGTDAGAADAGADSTADTGTPIDAGTDATPSDASDDAPG